MKNLRNSYLPALIAALSVSSVIAQDVIIFESPHLIVERHKNRLHGHYGADTPNFSCDFFFDGQLDPVSNTAKITSFVTKGSYHERDPELDLYGTLTIDQNNAWSIKLNDEPPGCGGAAGSFSADLNDLTSKFQQISITPQASIRVAKKKIPITIKENSRNAKAFLNRGDAVIIIKATGSASLIEHQPNNGDVLLRGWARSKELISPFPN